VNFCIFIFAAGHLFSSTVFPVSVNFEVEGQRTSKVLIPALGFVFCRSGGSKRNRVAILKSINDPRFGGVVRGHFYLYSIADG
jgi:hypothetical protein